MLAINYIVIAVNVFCLFVVDAAVGSPTYLHTLVHANSEASYTQGFQVKM